MTFRFMGAVCIAIASFSFSPTWAASTAQQGPELFGVKLKGAAREQMRQALKSGGMKPTRVDAKYWTDEYDPSDVLDGASKFVAGYVGKSDTFAFGEYTFDGFMDASLVTKVAKMVANKYGKPTAHEGNDGLGEVSYRWALPQGMEIVVSRGWPDTTTYLAFKDSAAYAALKAEMQAQRDRSDESKAKSQSKAF